MSALSRACAIAIVLMCGCVEHAYRVVPAPPARPMATGLLLGAWDSNFGAMRIEADESRGGLARGAVSGSWTYWDPSAIREVRGFFKGTQDGTVVRLSWREGEESGDGFLELSPTGDAFSGRWWNNERTKTGAWRGWRSDAMQGGV